MKTIMNILKTLVSIFGVRTKKEKGSIKGMLWNNILNPPGHL